MMKPRRAVFLDRDGTLITERGYLGDPARVEVLSEVGPALKRLQDNGYLLIIVTNQSGIGRGYYSLADMERVNARLFELLATDGVHVQKIYFAPEAPDQPSRGRKPSPQFLFDARDEFGIDLSQSYMIGDKLIDLQCGWNAQVKATLLVRTGYGAQTEQELGDLKPEAIVANDMVQAAEWILSQA
jgi:D-glycero-D-manno-heptose 1,7-bisphosphate phosphatase